MSDRSDPFDQFRRSADCRRAAAEHAADDDCEGLPPDDDDERFPELFWLHRMVEEPRPGYPRDWREQRLRDYLERSLERRDALRANLGGANADLLWLSQKVMAFAERWQPELSDGDFGPLRDLIATLGGVHEQLDRLATLDARLAETARRRRGRNAPTPETSRAT